MVTNYNTGAKIDFFLKKSSGCIREGCASKKSSRVVVVTCEGWL